VIRIHKPKTAPQKLTTDGKHKCKYHCDAYSLNPSAYEANTGKFDFASSIYAHESVKEALIKAQHQKCCFCERIVGKNGDVEHFRPKGAYQQAQGESLKYPAYYWLAYKWENLYLSCSSCNSRHKKNLFPLQDPITPNGLLKKAPYLSIVAKRILKILLAFGLSMPMQLMKIQEDKLRLII
jgi:hypothetical protein